MGSITDLIENEMLDHLFNGLAYSSPPSVWLALFEGAGSETVPGTEPVGNGYARTQITFGAAAARHVLNSAPVNFPQATGDWQATQLDNYGIFSQQTGGDYMAYGGLVTPITVVSGNTPTVGVNEIDVWFQTLAEKGGPQNNLTDYAANAVLEHLFRNVVYAPPATYLGYSQTNINDDGTGLLEPSPPNGYARLLVNPNGGASPTWRLATAGVVRNLDALIQATPTDTWGTLVCAFVADALALGNLLWYDRAIIDQLVNANDTVRVNVDQFSGYLT